jgi:hypothetical protein
VQLLLTMLDVPDRLSFGGPTWEARNNILHITLYHLSFQSQFIIRSLSSPFSLSVSICLSSPQQRWSQLVCCFLAPDPSLSVPKSGEVKTASKVSRGALLVGFRRPSVVAFIICPCRPCSVSIASPYPTNKFCLSCRLATRHSLAQQLFTTLFLEFVDFLDQLQFRSFPNRFRSTV